MIVRTATWLVTVAACGSVDTLHLDAAVDAVLDGPVTPASCKQLPIGSVSGCYTIDPDSAGPLPAVSAYCDMTPSDTGWTIVFAPMVLCPIQGQPTFDERAPPDYIMPLPAEATRTLLVFRSPATLARDETKASRAEFDLPAPWKTRSPFKVAGDTSTDVVPANLVVGDIPVTLVGSCTSTSPSACLRFGFNNFDGGADAGSACGGNDSAGRGRWQAGARGRICIQGAPAAPQYAGWNSSEPDECIRSDDACCATAQTCLQNTLIFTIAVR